MAEKKDYELNVVYFKVDSLDKEFIGKDQKIHYPFYVKSLDDKGMRFKVSSPEPVEVNDIVVFDYHAYSYKPYMRFLRIEK